MTKKNLNFDLNQINSFLEIKKQNSFTKAARELKISQATISHQILSLEKELGVKLIDRSKKEFAFTEQGKIFYTFSIGLASKITSLKDQLAEGMDRGSVKIAASTIPMNYILPEIIPKLKSSHPNFFYELLSSDSRETIELIKEAKADIGLVGNKITHPSLVYKKIYQDQIVLIGSEKFSSKIKIEQLKDLPFINRETGSGTKNAYALALKEKGISLSKLNLTAETSSSESIKKMVASHLGVAFISELAIKEELKNNLLKIIKIDTLEILRDFYVIYLKNKKLNDPLKFFLKLI